MTVDYHGEAIPTCLLAILGWYVTVDYLGEVTPCVYQRSSISLAYLLLLFSWAPLVSLVCLAAAARWCWPAGEFGGSAFAFAAFDLERSPTSLVLGVTTRVRP